MKKIFVAATGQHVGKTTLSLGLFALLKKHFKRVAFFKPVGQMAERDEKGNLYDKDVLLFKKLFGLETPLEWMNPVVVARGMTKEYLQSKKKFFLEEKIQEAYTQLEKENDFILIEGTGHVGVGSVIGMSNARIAALLESEMLLIAKGGVGSCYDEIAVNYALLEKHKVPLKGLILNQVFSEKREELHTLFKTAASHFSTELLGLIPFEPSLKWPSIRDFATLFATPPLNSSPGLSQHFSSLRLIAGSKESFLQEKPFKELLITPACRTDIIEALLEQDSQKATECGMILTGKAPPEEKTRRLIGKSSIPFLYAPLCSYEAMKKITSYTTKTTAEDSDKIAKAIELTEKYVNSSILF